MISTRTYHDLTRDTTPWFLRPRGRKKGQGKWAWKICYGITLFFAWMPWVLRLHGSWYSSKKPGFFHWLLSVKPFYYVSILISRIFSTIAWLSFQENCLDTEISRWGKKDLVFLRQLRHSWKSKWVFMFRLALAISIWQLIEESNEVFPFKEVLNNFQRMFDVMSTVCVLYLWRSSQISSF